MNEEKLEWLARSQLVTQRMLLAILRQQENYLVFDFKQEIENSRASFATTFNTYVGTTRDLDF